MGRKSREPSIDIEAAFRVSSPRPSPTSSTSAFSTSTTHAEQLLKPLANFDSLYICRIKSLPEPLATKLDLKSVRQYEIKDYNGLTRFFAVELTPECTYCCCSNTRCFKINMYDLSGNLVLTITRKCSQALCLYGSDICCYTPGVETWTTFHHYNIGIVTSVVTPSFTPVYKVIPKDTETLYYIRGPKDALCFCRECFINEFSICVNETVSVGKIRWGYDGLDEQAIQNSEVIGVIFPPRCEAANIACLLSAGFMLDINYFQMRGCTFHRVFRYFCGFGSILAIVGSAIFLFYWFVIRAL